MYHSAKCPSSLHTEDALARRCIPGGTPYKNRCYLICVQLLSAPSSVQTSLPHLWELCVNVTLSSFHHTIVSSEPSGSSTVLERQKTAKESYRSVSRNLHFICLIGTYTAIAMVAKLIWSNFDNLRNFKQLHPLQPLLFSFWRVLEAFPLALTSSTSFFNSSCGSFSTHSSQGEDLSEVLKAQWDPLKTYNFELKTQNCLFWCRTSTTSTMQSKQQKYLWSCPNHSEIPSLSLPSQDDRSSWRLSSLSLQLPSGATQFQHEFSASFEASQPGNPPQQRYATY